jgi:hypothetical protein
MKPIKKFSGKLQKAVGVWGEGTVSNKGNEYSQSTFYAYLEISMKPSLCPINIG